MGYELSVEEMRLVVLMCDVFVEQCKVDKDNMLHCVNYVLWGEMQREMTHSLLQAREMKGRFVKWFEGMGQE